MANRFEITVAIAAPPEQVWALAGDPGRIGEWFPPVVECVMEGDVRRVTLGNGAQLVERITRRDDDTWTYAYSVEEGIPGLVAHEAVIRVEGAPGGSRVRWSQDATSELEGYDAEERLGRVMTQGLESLRDLLEGAGGGD